MNPPSAKDALEKLKDKIIENIKETQEVILHAANIGNYTVAASLRDEMLGRQGIVYMIDEMLDELKTLN